MTNEEYRSLKHFACCVNTGKGPSLGDIIEHCETAILDTPTRDRQRNDRSLLAEAVRAIAIQRAREIRQTWEDNQCA